MKILKELLNNVDVVKTTGDLNVEILGIAYDSRKVKKGFVFVAVKGFEKDGHYFIDDAIDAGAVAIVLEKSDIDIHLSCSVIRTSDSRKALAVLSANFFGDPSARLKVVGITGTNGKTTTAMIVDSILGASGKKSSLLSTISYRVGDRVVSATRTTPESLELQKMFKEMVDEHIEYSVMEVSSHSLELHRVYKSKFAVGIFTNLTQDHLDFHETEDEYFKSKLKLFTDYDLGKAIVNIDDQRGHLVCKATSAETITIGIKEKADVRAKDIKFSADGIMFTAKTPKGGMFIQSKLIGMHNVYNILCAIGAGLALGFAIDDIKKGISSIERVAGRFEKIDEGQDFTVVVDYAHTDDALKNVITAARGFSERRIILLFGCGGDRDSGKRQKMGEVSGRYADYSVITSDNPRGENPSSIIAQIEKGLKKTTTKEKYCLIVDREEAIKKAISIASKGDIVILAGKGHETYQIVGDKNIPFDDSEVARRVLKNLLVENR